MVTEDYVSFETAKLLKEKGFDWCESPFYSEQDRDEWRQNNSYTIPNMEYNPDLPFDSEALTLVAPHVSIQMAMKWLREEHKLYCDIRVGDGDFVIDIISLKDGEFGCEVVEPESCVYQTYEEACEGAIKYYLEKLI